MSLRHVRRAFAPAPGGGSSGLPSRPDGGCRPGMPRAFLGTTGRQQGQHISGSGATVGSPALTQAQGPRQSHMVGPVQSHWPHSRKHLPAKAPWPGLAGWPVAGRPKGAGAWHSVSSPVTWCRVRGRLLDREPTHGHGGAGFVSQAILYFNFRCTS